VISKHDIQQVLQLCRNQYGVNYERGETMFCDVLHPAYVCPDATMLLTILLCNAIGVNYNITSNPFNVKRLMHVYGEHIFEDIITDIRSVLELSEIADLKDKLKPLKASTHNLARTFLPSIVVIDIYNRNPVVKMKVMQFINKVYKDSISLYPEFEKVS
jgi:hypothetical protein